MPVPTRIPSTYRRTPLAKLIDPVKFSLSRTAAETINGAIGAGGQDLLTAASIGQLSLRLQNLINVTARRIGLSPDSSIQSILDQLSVLRGRIGRGSITQINKLESAQIAMFEAIGIRQQLDELIQSQAAMDVLATRERVRRQVSNPTLREELLALIDDISRNTAR
jgi:hypothetical protein